MAVTTQPRPESRATTTKKWVYLFEEGNKDMRDLLGGKGAGVAEMTRAGLPVPPGFTITTEACNAYYASGKKFPDGMWEQAIEALHHVEEKTGKKLGDVQNPLLVSVRSGAKFSMPGMMDTVLNLGLNPQTLEGLAKLTNDRRFALDAYRRFIQMFGKIVLGIEAEKFEKRLELAKEKAKVKTDPELTSRLHRSRLLLVEQQARHRLPQLQQDPARPGDRRQRPDHGLRQHGQRLRHRRRLHARSQHRREGPLRRLPGERAGRGRGGWDPDAAADLGAEEADARRLQRIRN